MILIAKTPEDRMSSDIGFTTLVVHPTSERVSEC